MKQVRSTVRTEKNLAIWATHCLARLVAKSFWRGNMKNISPAKIEFIERKEKQSHNTAVFESSFSGGIGIRIYVRHNVMWKINSAELDFYDDPRDQTFVNHKHIHLDRQFFENECWWDGELEK